jgi:hypothetical protein
MPPRSRRHLPGSAVSGFVDRARIDAVLARIVADPDDRTFLLRCMLDEGPAHHRGANYVLLALLGQLLDGLGVPDGARPPGRAVAVPMRLPPHLEDEVEDADWPLALPVARLEALAAGPRGTDAMIDCLGDGPPQHAVANVVMVALLDLALDAAGARRR